MAGAPRILLTAAVLLLALSPLRAEPLAVMLDLDGDGAPDRAVLTPHAADAGADLTIVWGEAVGRSSRLAFTKRDIGEGHVFGLSASGRSLIVSFGCGGCSDDEEVTLTIVNRSGRMLVAGYRFDWDRRNGQGSCDINLLTGRATRTRGLAGPRPMQGRFRPVLLADWLPDEFQAACRADER